MGMECMHSSSVNYWPPMNCKKWLQPDNLSVSTDSILSHSAPASTTLFPTSTCRRAASFPVANAAFLSGELHVRSQSESTGLNMLPIKTPRSLIDEIKHSNTTSQNKITVVTFYTPVIETTQPPRKNKRRVRFADDCGANLSSVKVMTEPSDYPPQIPIDVLRRHRKAAGMEDVDDTPKPKSTWKVMFKQPASEYVKFRHKLENCHVALENAMIKNEFPKMIGTIKVANISFEKNVFLRCTSDNWKTYNDFPAKFQVSASKTYDTFTFEVPIPPNMGWKNSNFEFCICYRTGTGEEFWDSNDCKNYKLAGETQTQENTGPEFKAPVESKPLPLAKQRAMHNDAYMMDYDNWSKFASWKALSTDIPYW
ncbi:CBM21 domain-containing protein [Aphelenchoides besseyi]|nr:CBM21 domain-containing protein [Aphelenchoides besseyi]